MTISPQPSPQGELGQPTYTQASFADRQAADLASQGLQLTVYDRGLGDAVHSADEPKQELTERLQGLATKVSDIRTNVQTLKTQTHALVAETHSSFQHIADLLSALPSAYAHTQPSPPPPSPPPPQTPSHIPSLNLQPVLDSVSTLTQTLTTLIPHLSSLSAVSSLSEIQQTLASQPTQQDFGALQQSLRTGLTEAVRSLKRDLPTAPIPAITATLNNMFHNLTGHILNYTGSMLRGAVVAITKGENYIPPTFTTVTRPSPSSTAAPSRPADPTTAAPSSAPENPAAESAYALSKKVSLQMQKEELIRAGYDKDYVKDCDEERIADLLAKNAQGAEQQTLMEEQSDDTYMIRSWLWVPKDHQHYIRVEFEESVRTRVFKSMKEIYAMPLSFLQKLRKVKCINDESKMEEESATMTLNAYIKSQYQEKKGKGKADK